jgi:hypothetical protein
LVGVAAREAGGVSCGDRLVKDARGIKAAETRSWQERKRAI